MSNLPEPNFIDRDLNTIIQEMIIQYESDTGKTLQPAQIERLIVNVVAYREHLVRIGIQNAAKQGLVEYANFPMLDYIGELVGVERLPAQSALTTLRFTIVEIQTFDVAVPQGSQVESKDGVVIFSTEENTVITAGETYVDVGAVCDSSGGIGNGYLAGEISALISVLAYIDTAENTTTTDGGANEESDEGLRDRIKEAPESYSNAGSKGAYEFFAKSAHQNIVDVAVMSPSPGVINIYPLMIDGNPSQEILDLVSTTVTDETVRPLTDNVNTISPSQIDFQITTAEIILYNSADTETVQSNIQTALDNYKSDMKSRLGKDIVPSQIIALINSVDGVYRVDLTSPVFTQVATNEWANCTSITTNITGYTDG